MQSKDLRAAPSPARFRLQDLRAEWLPNIKIAAPMSMAYVGQMALGATDLYFIGQLSPISLAAGALVSSLYLTCFLFSLGVTLSVTPLAGQALAEGDRDQARRVTREGLRVGLILTIPATFLLMFTEDILLLAQQDMEVSKEAGLYMQSYAFALIPQVGFIVFRSLVVAMGKTSPPMIIMFCAIPINAFLDYALIFGHFGFPELGLFGAGLTTAIVSYLTLIAFALVIAYAPSYRDLKILSRLHRAEWSTFRDVFKLGFPMGIGLTLEEAMFVSGALIMGLIGIIEQAAHQVAMMLPAVTYMFGIGFSDATTSRTARAYGLKNQAAIYRATYSNVLTGACFNVFFAVCFLTWPEVFAGIFIGDHIEDADKVLAQAAIFIQIAALFQLFDGLQLILIGALHGLSDARVPMYLSGIGYILCGTGAAIILSLGLGLGGEGVWFGWAIGLAMTSILFAFRFAYISKRLRFKSA